MLESVSPLPIEILLSSIDCVLDRCGSRFPMQGRFVPVRFGVRPVDVKERE